MEKEDDAEQQHEDEGNLPTQVNERRVLAFFVNLALAVCDMASFILASVAVLVLRGEVDLYSSRFHFGIELPWYVLVCAVIWVLCMNAVGVYHRHVMGDGYQLNLLARSRVPCSPVS